MVGCDQETEQELLQCLQVWGWCVTAVLTAVLQEASTLEMMNLEFDSFFYPATASIDGVVITQVR